MSDLLGRRGRARPLDGRADRARGADPRLPGDLLRVRGRPHPCQQPCLRALRARERGDLAAGGLEAELERALAERGPPRIPPSPRSPRPRTSSSRPGRASGRVSRQAPARDAPCDGHRALTFLFALGAPAHRRRLSAVREGARRGPHHRRGHQPTGGRAAGRRAGGTRPPAWPASSPGAARGLVRIQRVARRATLRALSATSGTTPFRGWTPGGPSTRSGRRGG